MLKQQPFLTSIRKKRCEECSPLFQSLVLLARVVWGCCPTSTTVVQGLIPNLSTRKTDVWETPAELQQCLIYHSRGFLDPEMLLGQQLDYMCAEHRCQIQLQFWSKFYYIWLQDPHNFCCTWKNETTDPFMSTPEDKMPYIFNLVGLEHYSANVLQWILGN